MSGKAPAPDLHIIGRLTRWFLESKSCILEQDRSTIVEISVVIEYSVALVRAFRFWVPLKTKPSSLVARNGEMLIYAIPSIYKSLSGGKPRGLGGRITNRGRRAATATKASMRELRPSGVAFK